MLPCGAFPAGPRSRGLYHQERLAQTRLTTAFRGARLKAASAGWVRRYARALLDVTFQQSDPERVRNDLREAAATLAGHPELLRSLAHPGVAVERKRRLIAALWGERVPEPVIRLMTLLVERGRIAHLSAVAESYSALWNTHRNVATAEVVSVSPLEAGQRASVQKALEKATGLGIELKPTLDPAILGGLLVRVGGQSYDGTIRARLKALRECLAGTGTA